jgi:uncharacterized protein (DUF1778 family)
MNALQRDTTLTIRIASEEKAMLAWLAEQAGLNMSDWLRLTIRAAYTEASATEQR